MPVAKPDNFVDRVLMNTGQHLREAVGVLGWLDTPLPESMYALWFFAAGLVVMIALVTREYMRAIGASAALALFVVVGWVLEIVQGRTAGLFWQGRYALPVLVGMVIVAAMGSDVDRRIGAVAAAVPGRARARRVERRVLPAAPAVGGRYERLDPALGVGHVGHAGADPARHRRPRRRHGRARLGVLRATSSAS